MNNIHSENKIHGDINNSNILITEDKFICIDPLNTKFERVAIGGTPGWASPEQVLGGNVSEKTDVYSLALVIINFIDGIIHGEESCFVIPTKKAGTTEWVKKKQILFKSPKILIQKNEFKCFRKLLEQCLQ